MDKATKLFIAHLYFDHQVEVFDLLARFDWDLSREQIKDVLDEYGYHWRKDGKPIQTWG